MSDRTLQIIRLTRSRLKAVGRRLLTARLVSGVVVVAGGLALMWFGAALLEAAFWFSTGWRTVIVAFGATVLVATTTVLVVYPLLQLIGLVRRPSDQEVARRVEAVVPGATDRLVAFLDLSDGRHTSSPNDVVEEALHGLYEPFRNCSFDPAETFDIVRRTLKFSALPLLALVAFIASAPETFMAASTRLIQPSVAFVRPAPFSLRVAPGNADVVKGDSLSIQVTVDGNVEVEPSIEIRHDGERVRTSSADAIEQGVFAHVETNIRDSFDYRAVTSSVTSPWYRVEILNRPVVRQLMVTVTSPRYSRLGRIRLDPNVGDITALPGSMVGVEVMVSGGRTAAGHIEFDDGSRVPMNLTDDTAAAEFRLVRSGSYHIELLSDSGIANENPIQYRLQLVADGPPSVAILTPGLVAELTEPFEAPLVARIVDDFGIRKLALMYRRAESRFGVTSESFRELEVNIPSNTDREQVIEHLWNVADTAGELMPGDIVEYFLRVWDNDSFAGYKTAESRVHRLVMPSLADRYREMNETTDESVDQIDDLIEKADEVGDRFRELRDELQRKPESDWADERQLEQIQEMQRQLEQNIENVSSGLQDLAQKMSENNLVSEETLEMFEQLQKAIDEINSPEMMEALEKLRESMKSLDLQQMQQSMNDFEFNEDQFKERLARALELFKRLQIQQGLEEAAKRAEELAKMQQELHEATSKVTDHDDEGDETEPNDTAGEKDDSAESDGKDTEQSDSVNEEPGDSGERNESRESGKRESELDRLAAEQEQSESEMRDLLKRLEEIQKQMNEISPKGGEQLQELREQMQREGLPEQMRQNAEQLRNEDIQPAMDGQQQMQQQLLRHHQQLDQMQQNMRGNQLQLNISGLRQVLNDILVLSQHQEEMRNDVSATEAESPALRRFARQQIELGEGLRVVSDTLQKLSREIPEMSRQVQVETGLALREIQLATEALADRSARRSSGHQKASMMHLNELALLLSDLLNMLMNQQSGMGMPSMQQMLEQMQQMSGQQQQINQQIQQLLNDMQGQRLSSDAQARMRQLAEQQSRLREQLKELSRNPELRGKALGDLDKIVQQMEETIQELQHSRVSRELLERQQQILTRMLDASRSINERGKENRREGRTGEEIDRESPAELSPEERTDQLRRDLIRALESGYAPDYEELIRRYFKLLQEVGTPVDN